MRSSQLAQAHDVAVKLIQGSLGVTIEAADSFTSKHVVAAAIVKLTAARVVHRIARLCGHIGANQCGRSGLLVRANGLRSLGRRSGLHGHVLSERRRLREINRLLMHGEVVCWSVSRLELARLSAEHHLLLRHASLLGYLTSEGAHHALIQAVVMIVNGTVEGHDRLSARLMLELLQSGFLNDGALSSDERRREVLRLEARLALVRVRVHAAVLVGVTLFGLLLQQSQRRVVHLGLMTGRVERLHHGSDWLLGLQGLNWRLVERLSHEMLSEVGRLSLARRMSMRLLLHVVDLLVDATTRVTHDILLLGRQSVLGSSWKSCI